MVPDHTQCYIKSYLLQQFGLLKKFLNKCVHIFDAVVTNMGEVSNAKKFNP